MTSVQFHRIGCPRLAILACTLAASFLVLSLPSNASAASGGGPSNADYPTTPPNKTVDIFTTFPSKGSKSATNPVIDYVSYKAIFERYGYTVNIVDAAHASYRSFAAIAQEHPGILIFDSHGLSEQYDFGKDLLQHLGFPTTGPVTKPANIVVQFFSSQEAQDVAFEKTFHSDFKAGYIIPVWADDFVGNEHQPALGITADGISHFFGAVRIGLVIGITCDSDAVRSGFLTKAFLGYAGCTTTSTSDFPELMNDLEGKNGLDTRNTSTATAGSLMADSDSTPITLAPAVSDVTPADQGTIQPGSTTHVKVNFDTMMKESSLDSMVKVYGCDGKISNDQWSNNNRTLTFDLKVPKKPTTTKAELYVLATGAVAGNGGYPIELDGNTFPAGKPSGGYPNMDPYSWTLNCSTGLNLYVSGTLNGYSFNGQVMGPDATVTCTSGSDGTRPTVVVQWRGFLKTSHSGSGSGSSSGFGAEAKVPVNGEFDGFIGTSAGFGVGNQGPDYPDSTVEFYINGGPASSNAAASNVSGAGTITFTSAKSGTVNATLTTGGNITVKGSWSC